jgi:hypothetical protein
MRCESRVGIVFMRCESRVGIVFFCIRGGSSIIKRLCCLGWGEGGVRDKKNRG